MVMSGLVTLEIGGVSNVVCPPSWSSGPDALVCLGVRSFPLIGISFGITSGRW